MIGLTSDVLCVLLYYTGHSDIHTDTHEHTPSSYPICPTISTPIQPTLRSICHTHMHAHIENIAYTNAHTHPHDTPLSHILRAPNNHIPCPSSSMMSSLEKLFPSIFLTLCLCPLHLSLHPSSQSRGSISLRDLIIESIKRVQWPWQIDLIYNIIISSSNMGERNSLTGEDGRGNGRGNLSYFIYS